MESVKVSDSSVTSYGDGLEQLGSGAKGSENLGDVLLKDLDLYWEDIEDRLMILRMVSESVVKGMVNAVEQEAAEKIAAKKLELAVLKETLQFRHVGMGKIESSGSLVMHCETESINNWWHSSLLGACVEHDNMRESLCSLRNVAREQLRKLKKEMDGIRGRSSIRRISSSSEMVGLGGILQEKASEGWVDVDRILDNLKTSVDNICTQVDDMLHLSETSLCEWQQQQEFQRELEAMVIQSSIRGLQDEFEEKLWDQNAHFSGIQSVNWLEKCSEISNLLKELDAILKSLSNPEAGQLVSHGSCDMDHYHRKALSNHVSSSTSLWEGNGKFGESKTGVPENFDAAQLKHMSKEELVNYFNTMITKLKRNHESTVQELTEEYYSLKREYLKERGSSLSIKKDKDFDILRKKIPEVISKLDGVIGENEKLPAFSDNAESLGSLKNRLDSLLSENRQLRDSLFDKKNEVKCLSSQVSNANEKLLKQSLAEANLLKLLGNLNSAVDDAHVEASISEEVHKCVLRELSGQIKCGTEESEMEFIIMKEIYGIVFSKAAHIAETTSMYEIESSDMESLIMDGFCGVIFGEAIKDAEGKLKELYAEYLTENENRLSSERKASEKENELRLEFEEKERLKQEVLALEMSIQEKEKLAMEESAALMKERKLSELASQELNNLRDHASQQQTIISNSSKELDLVKSKLVEASEQVKVDKTEINKLNQKLELATELSKEADEQIKKFHAVIQEKQNDLLLVEAKEKEHRKQIEALNVLVSGLSKELADFECRATKDIKTNNLRLEHSSSQLCSLIKKANILRRTGLLYKERLERRCSDLQMAEAEVDLLGDEVDTLSSLLERIYIALDHYSPILQHYPGIIEILKLVRRELSEESTKPV